MKILPCALLLHLILAGALSAQQPVVTADTPVDHDTLRQWLHSADPRLIAWAADFAHHNHDSSLIADMPAILQRSTMPPEYGGDETQSAQRRAILAILDTLIQENAEVPAATIEAIAPSFPSQAVILVGRLPLSASRDTLDQWTYGTTGTMWTQRMLARIASMMLAKDPLASTVFRNHASVGFVASVVDDSEVDVNITVRSESSLGSGVGTGVCGDSFGSPLTPGWPQVYTYALDEANQRKVSDPVVVDLDGDQIFSRRHEENGGWGSCGEGVVELNPVTRHRLLAYWLGLPDRDMSWQPVDSFAILWRDKPAYQARLGEIIESERYKLQATVDSLRQRGLLKPDESAMPRLVVTIHCDKTPCPLR